MNILDRINNAVAAFNKTENNIGVDPNAYLKYGPRRMAPKWTTPEIGDRDFYTGYGFAVINKRANRSVVLGKKFLYTDAKDSVIAKANETGQKLIHPYLDLIRSSIDFSERDFWYDISTYLDLEGVYFLMAVRTVRGNRVGNIQKFVLLNPYNVRQVTNAKGELGGYVEQRGNMQRQIPKEMIIPIRLLNPFDNDKAYSLADAARDSQYTLKQANDFAREAIDGNLNAPGILSSAIELPDDQFDNFVERVKSHGRGEPLFGNGAGTISWVDMQADLDKAALDKINSINRDTLLAISGLSKTGVGVEESGTGREVSRTQKDDFTENAIMPQIENIIDALNLDYRKYYDADWKRLGYTIALDNPLETNKDAEQADVNIRDSQFELMQSMVAKGYSVDIAAKYAKGLIDITDIGEPASAAEPDEVIEVEDIEEDKTDTEETTKTEEKNKAEKDQAYEGYPIPVLQYLTDHASQIDASTENSSTIYSSDKDLKSIRISEIVEDGRSIVARSDNGYITLGEFHDGADRPAILAKLNKRYKAQPVAVKKKIESADTVHTCHSHDLETFKNAISDASYPKEFEGFDNTIENLRASASSTENAILDWYLDEISAGKLNPRPESLEQFVNGLTMPFAVFFTVMFPVFAHSRALQTAKDLDIDDTPIIALREDMKAKISEFAQRDAESHVETINSDIENALHGILTKTQDIEEIKQMLQAAFDEIQDRRLDLIATNAAARIYSYSNYEADLQLLARNDLTNQAYKQLFSLSGDPCLFCDAIISQTEAEPIPFTQDFVELGDTIEVDGKKMTFNYEAIESGNLHPNCMCAYRIIIEE